MSAAVWHSLCTVYPNAVAYFSTLVLLWPNLLTRLLLLQTYACCCWFFISCLYLGQGGWAVRLSMSAGKVSWRLAITALPNGVLRPWLHPYWNHPCQDSLHAPDSTSSPSSSSEDTSRRVINTCLFSSRRHNIFFHLSFHSLMYLLFAFHHSKFHIFIFFDIDLYHSSCSRCWLHIRKKIPNSKTQR